MLRILDLDKNPIFGLSRYKECSVTSSLDFSDKTLKFKAHIEDVAQIVNECYIEDKTDRYVVKEINDSSDGNVEIVAQLDMETLEGKAWTSFESKEQTIDKCLALAFVGTGWTVGTCEITKKRTMRMTKCSSLDILKEALKVYRCEVIIDSLNQKVHIYEEIGEDKGVYFTPDLNLKELKASSTTYDFYTELEAYGKKESEEEEADTNPLHLSSLSIGSLSLSPEFDPSVTKYTAYTINSSDRISARPLSSEAVITVTVNDLEFENGDNLDWKSGRNTVSILVEANGSSLTYTVTVAYEANQVALSGLSIGSCTLEPEFTPKVYSYTTYTRNTRNRISASANRIQNASKDDKTETTLSITANGGTVENGEHATWSSGNNTLRVTVAHGSTSVTYTVTVRKVAELPQEEPEEEEDLTLTLGDADDPDGVVKYSGGVYYVTNYSYSTKKKRFIWKDDRYSVAESLLEDAIAKLADMAKPYLSYSVEIRDLASASAAYDILAYDLGDTVTIIDPVTGTREKQRIVEITKYEFDPDNNSCTLANKVLTFDELEQKWQTTADTVDNVTSDNGTIDGSKVKNVSASNISGLYDFVANHAYIQSLETDYLYVAGKLTAVEADIGTLNANIGNFEVINAQELNAVKATIQDLRVTYLEGDSAKITVLEADNANIKSLLAGQAGIGDLQTIQINSQNATIDVGLVRSILAHNITVADLMAGTIDTSKFRIQSPNGGIIISDATQQFRDADGNLRLQLGQDAKGDFTFVLYDATGSGVLIDSTGIKESAIGDGLIKNSMVADNAAISATKLDIASLFSVINDSSNTIYANRIWFDDQGQSLNQLYTSMSSSVTTISSKADSANAAANNAVATANQALEALSGISTLDAISVLLSNDAHVVHTETDGSGGIWTDCKTTVDVYLGDTIVSDQVSFIATPSSGVTGTWDEASRTYQVTGMSTDNGYVDFTAIYESAVSPLTTKSGQALETRSGEYLTIKGGGTRISKRFSISKAPDGKIGLSYNLTPSVSVIRVDDTTGDLTPTTVTFSTTYNDNNVMRPYSGYYLIEESRDGNSWTARYTSSGAETSVVYTPSNWLTARERFIRATIKDASNVVLDTQSVVVLVDAEGLAKGLSDLDKYVQKFVTETYQEDRTEYIQSKEQFSVDMATIKTEISGISDGSLVWQPMYGATDTTVTLQARMYRGGVEITKDYPANWYSWTLRTEDGETFLGTGYTKTFSRSLVGFGGVVVAQFATYDTDVLKARSGAVIQTRSGKNIELYVIT